MTISGHMLRMAAAVQNDIALPDIGDPFEGGFFAGLYTDNGETYALVIAPKSAEIEAQWKTSQTTTSGTDSVIDGLANSNAMNNTTHPAAKYCRDYRGGGFDDWFLPAQNQLEIAYYELKPGTSSNDTNSGINPNAVPPRNSNYTANNPSQTSIAAFRTGGAQAFEETSYWSSTQLSANDARGQHFITGFQGTTAKTLTRRVRPCRSVKIS